MDPLKNYILKFSTAIVLSLILVCVSQAKPTIEDYGRLPDIQQMAMSPNGDRLAIAREIDDETSIIVLDLKSGKPIDGTRLGKLKFRGMAFINEELLFFSGTETTRLSNRIRRAEIGANMVYNIATDKTIILLGKEDRLQPFSSASGIEHLDRGNELVFMSAREGFYGGTDNPINLYRVDARTGKGKRHKRGTPHTNSWFIGAGNTVVGRTDYHGPKQEFRIISYLSGKEEIVYRAERLRAIDISATVMSPDEKEVYVEDGDDYYSISLVDGSKGKVPNLREDMVVAGFTSNGKGVLDGIVYDGTFRFVEYFDNKYNVVGDQMRNLFAGNSVSLLRSQSDTPKHLVHVNGSTAAGDYFIFDSEKNSLSKIGSRYPGINKDFIGEVQSIEYKARDGLTIPAILTWPVGVTSLEERQNLPLIVLPHGGPEAHDTIGFDWWSQYLAFKGYLVLQPNFRGSTGYGEEFTELGHGKWGKEMQDDVSDGVLKMIKAGYADKDRVCIMGASYGGYAAKAGGAFTPELYRCVVAVAGVSDLNRMLRETKLDAGSDHWVVRHWEKLMGEKESENRLFEVSPINSAENFVAPALIIHGVDDTVVPVSQSRIMHNALERADKNSTLVELEGEDHNLSRSKTRLEMLEVISKFLDEHNPA